MCSAGDDPTYYAHALHVDVPLAVEAAMTEQERADFLTRFIGMNAAWRGASVADILDALNESDSHLAIVEPVYVLHSRLVPEPGLLGTATRAVILAYGLADPETAWASATLLIARVRAAGEAV